MELFTIFNILKTAFTAIKKSRDTPYIVIIVVLLLTSVYFYLQDRYHKKDAKLQQTKLAPLVEANNTLRQMNKNMSIEIDDANGAIQVYINESLRLKTVVDSVKKENAILDKKLNEKISAAKNKNPIPNECSAQLDWLKNRAIEMRDAETGDNK